MLNFSSVLVFSEDPERLVEFYSKVFEKDPEWSGGDFSGWLVGNAALTIGPHDKVTGKNKSPERIMINLESNNVREEFERVKRLGTTVIAEPYHPGEEPDMWIATFEDPDGNYFQIMSPFEIETETLAN